MGIGRIVCVLAVAALWAQPPLPAVSATAVTAQNSASGPTESSAASSTETSPATVSGTATQGATSAVLPGPIQPIPFSHKEHAGTLKMPCEFCHAPSPSGATLKIPQAEFCMRCHRTLGTGDPGVEKLRAYAKSNPIIPWVRIYQLPSFVDFSHKNHQAHGITCQQCHGPVAERVQLFQESDISMGGCINCHQAHKAPTGCDTCHEIDE